MFLESILEILLIKIIDERKKVAERIRDWPWMTEMEMEDRKRRLLESFKL